MSCFHPLKRFVVGEDIKADRDVVRFSPAFIEQDGRLDEVTWLVRDFPSSDWRPYTGSSSPPESYYAAVQGQMIRCGKCLGCRMDKSKEWANRCLMELQYHQEAYFLTLTYDDQHVPITYYPDPETGEAQPALTLRKKDFQAFMKRLRKRCEPDKLRFFACGEYGGQTHRPHYHAIVFGLRLNDLVLYEHAPKGDLYQSNFLTSVWATRKAPRRHGSVTPLTADPDYFSEPWGRVLASKVTWATCAYVARYTTKKLYGPDAVAYDQFNLERPFLDCSKGLGRQYYEDHAQAVQDFDYINIATEDGGRKFRAPYYFERFIQDDLGDDAYAVRKADKQALMAAARRAQIAQTSLTYGELLTVQEDVLKKKTKSLQRNLE